MMAVVLFVIILLSPSPLYANLQVQTGVSMKCVQTNGTPGTKQNHQVLTSSSGVHLTIEGTMVCTTLNSVAGSLQVTLYEELDKLITTVNTKLDELETDINYNKATEDDFSEVISESEDEESDCRCKEKVKLFENLVALTETTLNVEALNSCIITELGKVTLVQF